MCMFVWICAYQLVFLSDNVGNVHVVGGGAEFFEFLASEDVDSDEMDLSVTVLSSLGGGHVDDLARTVLDDNEAVLSQGRTLDGVGGRGASIGGLEGVLFMLERSSAVSKVHLLSIVCPTTAGICERTRGIDEGRFGPCAVLCYAVLCPLYQPPFVPFLETRWLRPTGCGVCAGWIAMDKTKV